MKKLYAKTTFSNRKSNKNNKQIVEDVTDADADLNDKHKPILAYQSATPPPQIIPPPHPATVAQNSLQRAASRKSSLNSYKQPFAAATLNADQLTYILPTSTATSTLLYRQLQQQQQLQQQEEEYNDYMQDESTRHYYSIAELEDLNMLDHRHPQYQRQLRYNRVPYHEHQKLVLQLPMVESTSSCYNDDITSDGISNNHNTNVCFLNASSSASISATTIKTPTTTKANITTASSATSCSSPIYEAPQIATLPVNNIHRIENNENGDNDYNDSVNFLPLYGASSSKHSSMPITISHQHILQSGSNSSSDSSGYNSLTNLSDVREGSNNASDYYQRQQHKQQQQLNYLPQRHNSVKANFINANFEQSIIGARASVMVYDDTQKKWVPSGSSSGLSKVQIYHHQQNNTFRVVGRKLHDHEVVINCSIVKGLKYNQATATFHQWRDSKNVYGLNFSSQQDAEGFARAMMHALEVLSARAFNNPGQPTNGNGYEEDMGYRTMTSEDAAILRQQQIAGQVTPSAQTPTSQANQNNIPQSPPTPQGHHRTSRNSLSAPPAPQPQQMSIPQQQQQAQQLYEQTTNGPTQNGMQQQSQTHIPPVPGQTQYHAPQQMPQQQQQQQQHAVYASQQMMNTAGYQQNQQGVSQPPMPPPHQSNGPIYVSTQAQLPPVGGGLPTSASSNSVVYASQPQMVGNVPIPPQPPQPPAMPNGPSIQSNAYVQLNGVQNQHESPYGQVPVAPPMMQPQVNNVGNIPMPPPLNRMSSGGGQPPVAPPPPSFGGGPGNANPMFNGSAVNAPPPPQPPAPPAPPAPPIMMGGPAAPPPPPPPPMGGMPAKKEDPQAELMGSLAAQLQQAKLKKNKTAPPPTENSGSSTSSGGSGNYGTIGPSSSGMASMMDEMAKTLARRRAQAEKKEPDVEPEVKQRPWEKSNTLPHKLGSNSNNASSNSNSTSNGGSESPRPMRKRFGSASEETILKVNGDGLSLALSSGDLDTLKAEIVREMRLEIQKVKQEIIDAIKSEFNRR